MEDIEALSEPLSASGGSKEGNPVLTSHLALPALLIRETVQNSWDARDETRGDDPVVFRVDGWDLDSKELEHLRDLMPVQDLDGFTAPDGSALRISHPGRVHEKRDVRVLVISDRRTVGLCGPTKSGVVWNPPDRCLNIGALQPRFANFIRNQGRGLESIGEGDGGSYGVGKSVLWTASRCGTALVHTRTIGAHGEPVDRFIGTIRGTYFVSGSREYTGRHFIGLRDEDELIRPLEGSAAEEARRGIPIPSYELDGQAVMGTSIVIVEPRLDSDWSTEMKRIRDAVRWHVWPKLVAGVREAGAGPDMRIELSWNGNQVAIPDPLEDPETAPYARTLIDCARQRSAPEPNRDFSIESERPRKVLGDLKFRSAGPADEDVFHVTDENSLKPTAADNDPTDADDRDPIIDANAPWRQVALIRRKPLLLVRYEPITSPASSLADLTVGQVGVFLSADDPEVESALTLAEPAAHDDWIASRIQKTGPKDYRKTFVNVALKRLKEKKRAFLQGLQPMSPTRAGTGEQEFSKRLSKNLFGGLTGGIRPRADDRPTISGAKKKPSTDLRLVTSRQEGTGNIYELAVAVKGSPGEGQMATLSVTGAAYDSVGKMNLAEQDEASFRWTTADGTVVEGAELTTSPDQLKDLALEVTVPRSARIRPKVSVEFHDVEHVDGP